MEGAVSLLSSSRRGSAFSRAADDSATSQRAARRRGAGQTGRRVVVNGSQKGFSRILGGLPRGVYAGSIRRADLDQFLRRARARNKAKPARPYMLRLMTLHRITCPSTRPSLHGSVIATSPTRKSSTISRENNCPTASRARVGELTFNRRLFRLGHELKASQLAASVSPEARKLVQIGEHRQW